MCETYTGAPGVHVAMWRMGEDGPRPVTRQRRGPRAGQTRRGAGSAVPELAHKAARTSLRRAFRSEQGGELLDVPRAPLPDPEQLVGVRFLPTWDATLLVHARRARILPEEHRQKIFRVNNPHSDAVFLVDGAVAGTWKHRARKVELTPFDTLDGATRRELHEHADRLADFHA